MKARSELNKQRPHKKGWSKNKTLHSLFLVVRFLLLGIIITTYLQHKASFVEKDLPTTPRLSLFIVDPNKELPEGTTRKKILQRSLQIIKKHPNSTPESLAALIHIGSSLSRVGVLRKSPTDIEIQVHTRVPVFITQAKTMRLVSSVGEVYGSLDDLGVSTKLPTLRGVFTKQPNSYILNQSNKVIISDQEQLLVQEAIMLLNQSQDNGLQLSEIKYEKHLGFYCVTAKNSIQLMVGRKPFLKKIARAHRLVMSKHNIRPIRQIDLNYNAKAFIRYKTKKTENYEKI